MIHLTELKNGSDSNIADPDGIWGEIGEHFEEILHDSKSYPGELKFTQFLSQKHVNNIIDGENGPQNHKPEHT